MQMSGFYPLHFGTDSVFYLWVNCYQEWCTLRSQIPRHFQTENVSGYHWGKWCDSVLQNFWNIPDKTLHFAHLSTPSGDRDGRRLPLELQSLEKHIMWMAEIFKNTFLSKFAVFLIGSFGPVQPMQRNCSDII